MLSSNSLKDKLSTLPLKPGCYLMKDKYNTIIYVGKAIKLKNRVNSYFNRVHDYKTSKLVSEIVDFDFIVCKNEKEALIMEYNLIKKYTPKYNIVFMDDKSYPYIELDKSNIPYLKVIRKNKNKKVKGRLFGPYPDVLSARNTVKLLNQLFSTRKCKNIANQHYCLYYHMNNCYGYCQDKIDVNITNDIKRKIISFLNGDTKDTINYLKEKMFNASENLNFEQASKYKNLIENINSTMQKQNVYINKNENFTVLNYAIDKGKISIVLLYIENGYIINKINHIDSFISNELDYLSTYLYDYYMINQEPNKLITSQTIKQNLDKYFNFKIETYSKGKKYQLVNQAYENALESLLINEKIITSKESYYLELNHKFKDIFNKTIKTIDIFDNSHTFGKQTVGALVVYENFKPKKEKYRKYKIEDGFDDLKSMYETLYRRYYNQIMNNEKLSDLLIVDGGINQIKVASEIKKQLNLNIIICGLSKDEHHNTALFLNENGVIIDIDLRSNIFYFLTNMQDEVHRYAISFHSKLRQKNMYKSILDNVSGLGVKGKEKLYKKYKDIETIKQLSIEELSSVLNKKTAEKVYNILRENYV